MPLSGKDGRTQAGGPGVSPAFRTYKRRKEKNVLNKLLSCFRPNYDQSEHLYEQQKSQYLSNICNIGVKDLLPTFKTKDQQKICLFIDLNETSFRPKTNEDFIVPIEIDGTKHQVYVLKRPFVEQFFCNMSNVYDYVLYTSTSTTTTTTTTIKPQQKDPNPHHTYGPIDGSLYATVAKSGPKKSPVTFSLPNDNTNEHTISIDSGISSTVSAHPQQHICANPCHMPHMPNMNGRSSNGYSSPINVEVEVHHQNGDDRSHHKGPTSQEQEALDELLREMLEQIQTLPDHPSTTNTLRKSSSATSQTSSRGANQYSSITRSPTAPTVPQRQSEYSSPKSLFNGSGYHSLGDQTASPDMIPPTRYITKPVSQSSSDDKKPYRTPPGSQPFSYGVTASSPALQRRRVFSESTAYVTENYVPKVVESDPRDTDDVFSDYASSSYQDTFSEDGIPLTWLQRQQQKLKYKHEGKYAQDRYWKEQRLMEELKSVAKLHRIPSQDSSRESSPPYSRPLHINTSATNGKTTPSPYLPTRTSSKNVWQTPSRPVQRQKSDNSYDRERPFVSVKRAHEEARQEMSTKTSPQHIAASTSLYGSVYPYNQHHIYMPNARDGLLMKTEVFDEVDSVRPKHSTPSYKSATVEAPTSWSPSFVSSSSPTSDRPKTPNFPTTPGTPYVNQHSRSPPLLRKGGQSQTLPHTVGHNRESPPGSPSGSVYYGQSQRSSLLSINDSEVITQHPVFVRDTSSYWYKPDISREEAINLLRDKPSGSFVVRDSHSFPGAFGLALKVATLPPSVQSKTKDISSELVRHFLIEPTNKGVRLKGCPDEPTFGSLSALVYQHSVTSMALPCKLLIPDLDPFSEQSVDSLINSLTNVSPTNILSEGAACNVVYLVTVDMESLTGPQAVRKAIGELISMKPQPMPTIVHFKVNAKGITLTDNAHRLFFRRHYPMNSVSFCGIDPDYRKWRQQSNGNSFIDCLFFGFIARKTGSKTDNQCHVFAEHDSDQPASAIVNFVNKVMTTNPSQRSNFL